MEKVAVQHFVQSLSAAIRLVTVAAVYIIGASQVLSPPLADAVLQVDLRGFGRQHRQGCAVGRHHVGLSRLKIAFGQRDLPIGGRGIQGLLQGKVLGQDRAAQHQQGSQNLAVKGCCRASSRQVSYAHNPFIAGWG